MLLRSMRHTKELADAKAENDALRDEDVAAWSSSVAHQSSLSVSAWSTASAWMALQPPRLADAAEQDYFTLRERLITMQKQLEGTKYV